MIQAKVDASDFLKVSKALKAAGRTGLRKNLHKGLKTGARPLIGDARQAARRELPKRGGLAEEIAKGAFRVQVRTGKEAAGVRVALPGRYVAARTLNDRGIVRHPVFPDARTQTRREWTWVTQPTGAKGWFNRAMNKGAPAVRPELAKAVQRTLDDIAKGV